MNLRSRGGFTLVELLTVLSIIVILVAIAVPIYNLSQQSAKDKADESNVRILNSATLQWMLKNEANDSRGEGINTETLKAKLEGVYVMEWPVSPNDGKSYVLDNGFWKVQ